MEMKFAEITVPVELGGVKRMLVFNANTMCAFEEATGKFYLKTISELYDVMTPYVASIAETRQAATAAGKDPAKAVLPVMSPYLLMESVPITTLRALVWSALHTYVNDEPVWPLTINQVGRMMGFEQLPKIFTAFLKGQINNSPTSEELGEFRAPSANDQGSAPTPKKIEVADGGELSIELPAGAFD